MQVQVNRDWRTVLKHYSTWALGLIGSFSTLWAASPEFQALLPPKWVVVITFSLAVLGLIGKFLKQNLEKPNV